MHEDTAFLPTAFEDFTYRAQSDRKILVKIKALIAGIHRNGLMDGLGKPERLLGQSGEFRRRITAEHRLVYRLDDDRLKILSCQDSVVPRTLPGQKNPRIEVRPHPAIGQNVLRGYAVSGRDCEPEDHSAYI